MAKKKVENDSLDVMSSVRKEIGKNDLNLGVSAWLDTGLPQLNMILSAKHNGGFPLGRIAEISGPPSCGKTMIATAVMKSAQEQGGFAIFLDFERTFEQDFARKLGLNVDDEKQFIYKRPTTMEEAFDMIKPIVDTINKVGYNKPIAVIYDSIPHAQPKSVVDKKHSELGMNDQTAISRGLSACLPKLQAEIADSPISFIMLNQIRDDLGPNQYKKVKSFAGKALLHACSVRVRLAKNSAGYTAKVIKNKTSRPHGKCSYLWDDNTGFDEMGSNIIYAKDLGIIQGKGAWFEFVHPDTGEVLKKQGIDNLVKMFKEDNKLYTHLKQRINENEDRESLWT